MMFSQPRDREYKKRPPSHMLRAINFLKDRQEGFGLVYYLEEVARFYKNKIISVFYNVYSGTLYQKI